MISIYLGKKVFDKRREQGFLSFDFLFGMFSTMTCLFISRLIYMYFDFYLTEFDSGKYYISPNICYYKIAGLIYLSGFVVLLFIIDKDLFNFKIKGILAYIVIGVVIIELIYPVKSPEDFEFISALVMIAFIVGLLLPVLLIYIGVRSAGIRTISFIFASGIIFFFLGVAIVAEFILAPLKQTFGINIQITVWIISLILQLLGLIMMTFASIRFK